MVVCGGVLNGDCDTLALLAQLVGIVQCSATVATCMATCQVPGVALVATVSRPCAGCVGRFQISNPSVRSRNM